MCQSPLSYIKQQQVYDYDIARVIYIPYPILIKWHQLGSDKRNLVKFIPAKLEEIGVLFPETKKTVIKLWKNFYAFYNLIYSDLTTDDFYLDIFRNS